MRNALNFEVERIEEQSWEPAADYKRPRVETGYHCTSDEPISSKGIPQQIPNPQGGNRD